MVGVGLLALQAFAFFCVMTGLLAARRKVGIGLFVCALGVMHFLESYLSARLFVDSAFGPVSPGCTVMFTGKLMMLLLLYIREDAEAVRQPIYGLLAGSLLFLVFLLVMRWSPEQIAAPTAAAELDFLERIGVIMLWGSVLLLFDCVLLITLYERLSPVFGQNLVAKAFVSGAVTLSLDQLAFYPVLRLVTDAPESLLFGGLASKVAAAGLFSLLIALYLRYDGSREERKPKRGLGDLFSVLTYRDRYEDLLARSLVDEVTGVKNRTAFEQTCRDWLTRRSLDGRPVTIAMADIDHFKSINDAHGHVAGDRVLRAVGATLEAHVRTGDSVFRYGGEEFAVLFPGLGHHEAVEIAERLRLAVSAAVEPLNGRPVTVSFGVASSAFGGGDLRGLLDKADQRLYEAKRLGRDRVVGDVALA